MTEYMLHWWGGCEKAVKEKYGFDDYLYFNTPEELNDAKMKLKEFYNLGLAFDERSGELTHKDTVAVVACWYHGQEYHFDYNFGKEYGVERARFVFFDGDYGCDCNLSLFIRENYGNVIPELDCGNEIEIIDFKVELR